MPRPPNDQPTDGELEILKLLWELGPAELGPICAGLQSRRKVANTTVATMLTVMLAKGLVKRKSGSRGYLWSAAVSRDAAASGLVGKLVDRLFDGSTERLVTHLIEAGKLTHAQQAEITSLIARQAEHSKHNPAADAAGSHSKRKETGK
jgi:BlaI family transcriptional regulator, penicillinase repressor